MQAMLEKTVKYYQSLWWLCVFAGWTGVNERTFIAVKPDGVQRKLVGEIIRRFERKGFKLVGLKFVQVATTWTFSSKSVFMNPG